MKTKKSDLNAERTPKILHPASVLVRRKRTKELKSKKSVRFNLMMKSSSSEESLVHKCVTGGEPGDSKTSRGHQGLDLRSKSSLDVAGFSKISRRNVLRSVACYLYNSIHVQQYPKREPGLSVRSFSQHYLLGPVLNLTTKRPRKGILKNVQNSSQTLTGKSPDCVASNSLKDFNSRLPAQVSSWPSAHVQEPAFTSCGRFNTAEFHHPVNTFLWTTATPDGNMLSTEHDPGVGIDKQVHVFDDLTKSIQNLTISAHPQGDLPHSKMNKTFILNEQAGFGYACCSPVSSVHNMSKRISESEDNDVNGSFLDPETVPEEDSFMWSQASCYDINNNAFKKSPNDNNSNQTAHSSTCHNHHGKLNLPLQTTEIQNLARMTVTTSDHYARYADNNGEQVINQYSSQIVQPNNTSSSKELPDSNVFPHQIKFIKSKSERSVLSRSVKRKSPEYKSLSGGSLNTCKETSVSSYDRGHKALVNEKETLVFTVTVDVNGNKPKQQHCGDGQCQNTLTANECDAEKNHPSGCLTLCSGEEVCDGTVLPFDDVLYRCPVLNCGQHFTQQQFLIQHLSLMQHSPCNPLSTLTNEMIPNICGFLCPLCGQIYQDDETCLDHMLKQGHSTLLSPVPFCLFACPHCLCLFSSFSLTQQHMDNLAHHELAFQFEYDKFNNKGASPIPVPQRLVTVLQALCSQVSYSIFCQDCRQLLSCPAQIQGHLDRCHIVVSKCGRSVKDVFSSLITDQACAECHQFIYTRLPTSELCVHTDCPLQGPVLTSRAKTLAEFILRCGITDINVGTEDNLDLHPHSVNSSISETCTVKAICHPTNFNNKESADPRIIRSHIFAQSRGSAVDVLSKTSSSIASPCQQGMLSVPTSDYTASPFHQNIPLSNVHVNHSLARDGGPQKNGGLMSADPFGEGASSSLCGCHAVGKHTHPLSGLSSNTSSVDTNSHQTEASSHSSVDYSSWDLSKDSVSSQSIGSSVTMGTVNSTFGQPSTSVPGSSSCSGLSVSCSTSSLLSVVSCQNHANMAQASDQCLRAASVVEKAGLLYGECSQSRGGEKSFHVLKNPTGHPDERKDQIIKLNNDPNKFLRLGKNLEEKIKSNDLHNQVYCYKVPSAPEFSTTSRPVHSLLNNRSAFHKTTFGAKTNNRSAMQDEEIQVAGVMEDVSGKKPVSQTNMGNNKPCNLLMYSDTLAPKVELSKNIFSHEESDTIKGDQTFTVKNSLLQKPKRKRGKADKKFPLKKKARVLPIKKFGKNSNMSHPLYMMTKQHNRELSVQESTYMIVDPVDKLNTQLCHNKADEARKDNVNCVGFFKDSEFKNQENGTVTSTSDSIVSIESGDRFVSSTKLSSIQLAHNGCKMNMSGHQACNRAGNVSDDLGLIETVNHSDKAEASEKMTLETWADCDSDSSDVDVLEIDEVRDRFIVVNESLAHDDSCFIVEDENEPVPDQDLCTSLFAPDQTIIEISDSDDSCFIVPASQKAGLDDSIIYVARPAEGCNQQNLSKKRKNGRPSQYWTGQRHFNTKKKTMNAKKRKGEQKAQKGSQNRNDVPVDLKAANESIQNANLTQKPAIEKTFSSTPLPKNSQTLSGARTQSGVDLCSENQITSLSAVSTNKMTGAVAKEDEPGSVSNRKPSNVPLLNLSSCLSQPSLSPIVCQPATLDGQSCGIFDAPSCSVDHSSMPVSIQESTVDSVTVISDHEQSNLKQNPCTEQLKKCVDHLGKKRKASLGTMKKWFAWKRKTAVKQRSKVNKSGTYGLYKANSNQCSASSNHYFTTAGTRPHAVVTGTAAAELHKLQQSAALQPQESTEQQRSEIHMLDATTSLKLRLDGPTCLSPDKSDHSLHRHQSTTTVKRSAHFRKLISPQMNCLSKMERIVFADLENVMLFKYVLGPWLPSTYVWGFISARPGSPFHSERYFHQFGLYRLLKEQKCVHISTDIGTSKDAVDFAMTLAIAKLDDRLPQSIPFFIVSRDKGFLEVENQMRASQRRVTVVAPSRYVFPRTHFA